MVRPDDTPRPRRPQLTRNQALVLDTLHRADAPLSAYDILDKLRDDGLRAPLQVYRALDKLVAQGLAHRLESVSAFVCCADAAAHGHSGGTTVFAICGACGRVEEFADTVVEDRLRAWTGRSGFVADDTTIELRGRCARCSEAAPEAPPGGRPAG